MSQNFDAYHVWLGIPPGEQPPHYYRLLGLRVLEPNPTVIDNALQRLTIQLQNFRKGPHRETAEQLLEEVTDAATCLLDPLQKAGYDQKLSLQRAAPQIAAVAAQPSAAAPVPPIVANPRPAGRPPAREQKKSQAGVLQSVLTIGGGLVGLAGGYLLVYYATGRDLFGILPDLNPPLVQAPVEQPPAKPPAKPTPKPALPEPQSEPDPKPAPEPPPLPRPNQPEELPKEKSPPPKPDPAPIQRVPPDESPSVVASAPRKLPQPSAEARQQMLAELQTIYKTEFDRGSRPDGREQLVLFLLETARKLKTDTTAQYALYREAFDRALRLEDFATVAETIDELEQTFDVDGYRLRLHLLLEASKSARAQVERLPLVEFAFALADYAQAADHPEEIAKFVSVIDSHARSIGREARSKFAGRLSELRKVAEELVPVVAARQQLASDPADADASLIDGKYRCFARGDWEPGLKLLAQSSHAALVAAANQDLAGATSPEGQAAIANQWFDLGMADPALTGALARARHWYQQALKEAPALERVKLERKLELTAVKLPPRLQDRSAAAAPKLASARELLAGQPAAN